MTKMHFERLAENLKAEKPGDNWDANKRVQWELDVKAVARTCQQSNSRFDVDRFLIACGLLEAPANRTATGRLKRSRP